MERTPQLEDIPDRNWMPTESQACKTNTRDELVGASSLGEKRKTVLMKKVFLLNGYR